MNQQHNEFESDHEGRSPEDDRARALEGAITIGDRLRLARKKLGYSRAHLAGITGISASTLKGYESGKRLNPRTNSLAGFAKARINVSWLLGDESAPMLLDTVENAEKTAVYTAALLGDEEAQRLVDEAHNTNMAKLTQAKELVERIAKELEFQPSSVIMGTLIGCVRLGRITEEGVRDVIKAVMTQTVLDARSRT